MRLTVARHSEAETDDMTDITGPMLTSVPRARSPFLADDLDRLHLSNRDRSLLLEFSEKGLVTVDLQLNDFAEMSRRLIDDLAPRYKGAGRLVDAWRVNRDVKGLACLDEVLRLLLLLYGRDAFPFQTLNFSRGTEQEVHSDTIHFNSLPDHFMAAVWIALEDIDANNGPLVYFPGSHKLPLYTYADMGLAGSEKAGSHDYYASRYEPFMREIVKRYRLDPVEVHVKRGQAVIWAANLLHGGSPVRQRGRSRHSQVTHYYFEDCIYYTPMWSDPALGRLYYRQPYDVLRGKPAQSAYCGKRFRPPPQVRAKEWLANLLRHVPRGP